jgi:hypothetical protein
MSASSRSVPNPARSTYAHTARVQEDLPPPLVPLFGNIEVMLYRIVLKVIGNP